MRLSRDLRRLPGLHAELGSLAPAARPGGRGQGDGLPYNERASECQDQIAHDLRWWVQHAAEDRGAPVTVMSVAAMAGLLRGALRWAVYRDWAGELAGVIGADRSQAVALLDPWVTRRFPVPGASCPSCAGGPLLVTVYASDGDRRRSHAACESCGQSWPPESWTRLGQQIIRRRELAA
jgi:hypothetical protein